MPDDPPALTGYVEADQRQGLTPPGTSVQPLRTLTLLLFNSRYQDHAVRAEVGLPLGIRVYTCTLIAPFGLEGYQFELVGTPATPADPPEAPRFVDQWEPLHPQTILAWRRQVRWAGSPLYLEARWHPERPATLDLRGVEQDVALRTLHGMPTALRLLHETQGVRRRGRPVSQSRYYTHEEFYARWAEHAATAQRRRGTDRVTDEDMARAYEVSLSTFRRYLREYGRPAP